MVPIAAGFRTFAPDWMGSFRLILLKRLVQWPVRVFVRRPIIGRLHRDPRLIAFGAPSGRFADNAAYVYLHMSDMSHCRCVWISGSPETVKRLRMLGLDAVSRWSYSGLRVALRASWYVFSDNRADVNTVCVDGAVTFNLWHGVGVKRLPASMEGHWKRAVRAAPDGSLTARMFADDRRGPDWLLSSTPLMSDVFAAAFGIPVERCVELGYPRNDHLAGGAAPPRAMVDVELHRSMEAARPIVGYFPTFRDRSSSLPGGASLIAEMSAIVSSQGGTLVFKAHDHTAVAGLDETTAIVVPKEADLNAYLGLCDVLITDFSSVAIDYLLLRRPVVLFCPDFDEFADGRGFNFDPIDMMPGALVRTTEELYALLSDFQAIPVSDKTDKLLQLYWSDNARPGACERVAAFIEHQIGHQGQRSTDRAAKALGAEERSERSQ